MTGIPHGTVSGYRYWGCRCGSCRAAAAACERAGRAKRKQLASSERIPHGTRGGHLNWGCRCGPCRAANAAYIREYNARRRQAAATAPRT